MSEPRPYMHPTADITLNGSATAVTNDVGAPYSGTSTNMVINLKDIFDGCSIQCITTSSLAVKVYVSMDFGTTFEPAVSVDQAGAMTAADSAVTPSAGDTISWNCSNATHVRISRTAGSGTVKFKAWTGSPPVTTVVGVGTLSGALKAEDAAHASGDLGWPMWAVRANTAAASAANGDYIPLIVDTNGALWVSLSTLIAGEDQTADVLKTEHRYGTSGILTTDTTVKSGAGFLHALLFAPTDATPTAGTITVYDNTAVGSGTKLFEWSVAATAFIPFGVIVDVSFATGLTVDFTTTADVAVFASYR